VENFVSDFALYSEFSSELVIDLKQNDLCVANQLQRFNLIQDGQTIRNLSPDVLHAYLSTNKSFFQERLHENCEDKMRQGLIRLLKEMKAEIFK
jgi:hypothetical protein